MNATSLERQAFWGALAAIGVFSALSLLAAAVRVLPFVVDPDVPWAVATPFARAVAWLALEASVAVGWPIGWALVVSRAVERGEARVYALLGMSPPAILRRFVPQSVGFAVLLAALSFLTARDAQAPGRIVGQLIDSGRASCQVVEVPTSVPVPFLDARWLCWPGAPPRLFVRPPRPAGAVVTASSARLSGDVRTIQLQDARLRAGSAQLSVRELEVRGLPPLVASATLRPIGRALALTAATTFLAFALAALILQRRIGSSLSSAALAGISTAAGFAALRAVDRAGGSELLLPLVPAVVGVTLLAGSYTFLCLRRRTLAATTI